jgi:hypothetical protein
MESGQGDGDQREKWLFLVTNSTSDQNEQEPQFINNDNYRKELVGSSIINWKLDFMR